MQKGEEEKNPNDDKDEKVTFYCYVIFLFFVWTIYGHDEWLCLGSRAKRVIMKSFWSNYDDNLVTSHKNEQNVLKVL